MNRSIFEQDVIACLDVLKKGGIILYPTDTIWGLGCDATNADAVQKIYAIKKRDDCKSMIILTAGEQDVINYVASPDLAFFDFLEQQDRPTTIIFNDAVSLPDNLVGADGSIAIRIVKDEFCRHLIKRLQKPIVSTSANISGQSSPNNFADVSDEVKAQVDYIVKWRQDDLSKAQPSRIVKWNKNGSISVIRE